MLPLSVLNQMSEDEFTSVLGAIFEDSSWIAREAWGKRPFENLAGLHAAMVDVVQAATPEQKLSLLRAHPELGARGKLTQASAAEQGGQGLDRLQQQEAEAFERANAAYRERFGFPFIIAVRGARDRAAILQAIKTRTTHELSQEIHEALAQVARIAQFRLNDAVHDDAVQGKGRLTTHILDTAKGEAATDVGITLYRLEDEGPRMVCEGRTDAQGRAMLLQGASLVAGHYEVVFHVAAWRGDESGFYTDIPVRFRVKDALAHYHVPLILAPYGYSTYRGG